MLKRAIRTLWIALDEMDMMWLPVERSWRLNERHYGALQGLDKAQTVAKHGAEQVKVWRRSYDIPPPPLETSDPQHPRFDRRYAGVAGSGTAVVRVAQGHARARAAVSGTQRIAPELAAGRNVLVAAHGNSLRAMVKMLDRMTDEAIVELNIPTGVPLLYELDAKLQPVVEPLPRRRGGRQGSRRGGGPADRKEIAGARQRRIAAHAAVVTVSGWDALRCRAARTSMACPSAPRCSP